MGYWNQAYSYIRAANLLLEVLPKYASNYTEAQANSFLGEAYFIRSMVYYSLVKRYGGVPVVDKVIDYPASVSFEDTKLFRASEEDTWDFIGADLDKAIELLPESNQKGRANKYAAAALKSRIMLHAGSIAKYNTVNYAPVNGVRVCGIPQEKAVGYFKAAYEASQIVDEGGYRLYMDKWSGNNRQAQIDNFTAIFLEDTYETIFGRYYIDPEFCISSIILLNRCRHLMEITIQRCAQLWISWKCLSLTIKISMGNLRTLMIMDTINFMSHR